jgi:hypothetical protein
MWELLPVKSSQLQQIYIPELLQNHLNFQRDFHCIMPVDIFLKLFSANNDNNNKPINLMKALRPVCCDVKLNPSDILSIGCVTLKQFELSDSKTNWWRQHVRNINVNLSIAHDNNTRWDENRKFFLVAGGNGWSDRHPKPLPLSEIENGRNQKAIFS